ncbi:diiron oxygenase [Haliangium sp.]|uniref:diiron oxygenase n=1 Tax=Haliangium sp. TaxID=2663208 RepID=UPI003D12C5BB
MATRSCRQPPPTTPRREPKIRSLAKIRARWDTHAQVRGFDLPEHTAFEPGLPDYLDELLPFHTHAAYEQASERDQHAILSCAWLLYNHKTIELEKYVLTPACLAIYDLDAPVHLDHTSREVIAQTLVDEAYHILMTHRVSGITRARRGLEAMRIPNSTVVRRMLALQAEHSERWQRDLILIVTAIVTEVFICGHLQKMSDATSVQPMNVLATKAHLADELVHRSVFRDVAEILHARLSAEQRRFFLDVFPKPAEWFADSNMDAWDLILDQLDFDGRREMVGDCRAVLDTSADYTILNTFLRDIGAAPLAALAA